MQSPQFAGRAGRGRLAARIAATAKRSPAKARMTSTKMKKRTPKVPISAEASRPYSRYQEVDMRKVRHALLVALALAGLGLAACGGAGGGGAGTTAAPTPAAPALGTNNPAPATPTPAGDPYSDYGSTVRDPSRASVAARRG